jgi:hypothetical protein
MTLLKNNFHRSPTLILVFAVLTTACELPAKLGEIPGLTAGDDDPGASSSSGDADDGSGGGVEPTTSEPPGEPVCVADDGAGALLWERASGELPGPLPALAAAPGGDVVAVGVIGKDPQIAASGDALIERHDPSGAAVWSRTYAGANGLEDRALDVAVDGAGFVHVLVHETVLVVQEEQFGYGDARLVVLRFAPDGAQQWRWEHERPPVEVGETYSPFGAIGLAGDRIVVVETAHDEPTTRTEVDASGAAVGEVELAVASTAKARRFAVDPDGATVLAGDFEVNGTHGIWVGRYAADGSQAWIDEFGSLDDSVELALADGAGGVYFAWMTTSPGPATHRVRRYDAAGAAAWTTTLPMTTVDSGVNGGVLGCDGALLLVGALDKPDTPELEWTKHQDLWIGRLTPDGAATWQFEHAFGGPFGHGQGVAIAATADGDVAVVGDFLDDAGERVPWLGRLGG